MGFTNKSMIKAVVISWVEPVMYWAGMTVLISSLAWAYQTLMVWFH